MLLCIHGWPLSTLSFKSLGDALPDMEVVAPNLPGFDGTDDSGFEHSLSGYADFICEIATDLDDEIHLVGHAMGGKLAMLIASQQPKWLNSLILLAPSYPDATIVPESVLASQRDAYGNPGALKTMFQHWANDADALVDDALLSTPGAYASWLMTGRPMDISADMSRIDVPTLAIHGELDPLRTGADLEERVIRRIPNAELHIIHGASHCIQMDQPANFASTIQDWTGCLYG